MGRPRTYDRDEVLRRAGRLFWERGYEGTSVRDLTEACGINRSSLYHEFGGKEGLHVAALEAYVESLAGLGGALEREPLGLDNVRAYLLGLLDHGFHHGCFAVNTLREKHVVSEAAWQVTRDLLTQAEEAVRRNLEAARRRGQIGKDTDPADLARMLSFIEIGLLTHGILEPERAPRDRALALIERLLR